MATPVAANPYLAKGFAPVRVEYDDADLVVEGQVPESLDGTFYRIGPNPQFPPCGIYNPLGGDGMVHAFRIRGGRVSYRNRWVRTQQWKLENEAGRALFATTGNPSDADPSVAAIRTDGVANTNLVWHGRKMLALEEGHAPIEIDPDSLDTIGRWSFNDRLPRNMTAHPKIDRETGEMIFFANFPRGRFNGDVELYVANASGEIVRSMSMRGPIPALIHDFAITQDFIVVWFCPVTVSIKRAMVGLPAIAWEPNHGTQIGVIPRNGGAGDFRWFAAGARMAWHSMNAFSNDSRIFVDVCEQDAAVFPYPDGTPTEPRLATQRLARWVIDWDKPGKFAIERLCEEQCEYPRIDERRTSAAYRYGYVACIGGPGSDDLFHRGIGRFDHSTREMRIYNAGPAFALAEPVFVPESHDAAEGDGYLLTNIYDEARDASHLAIFDASEIERGPIARAHLDHRVPVGFHGQWRGSV
ncbi:MAG TPA: carotenoid oxygenase family protein [Candidatus Binataceae bacterium]|nr:carotenoid oxygenase family protein [Candidatus Binataceae bacterium]